MIIQDLHPSEFQLKRTQAEMPNLLVHSNALALSDELNRLTRMEKLDLVRELSLSWNNELIGRGKAAFKAGLSLLWPIDQEERHTIISVFFQTHMTSPVLLLESNANHEQAPASALAKLFQLTEELWNYGQGQHQHTDIELEGQASPVALRSINALVTRLNRPPRPRRGALLFERPVPTHREFRPAELQVKSRSDPSQAGHNPIRLLAAHGERIPFRQGRSG